WTAFLKGPDGAVLGATNKSHATPLGETKPLAGLFPALHRLTPKLKRMLPGPSRVLDAGDGRRLGVYICYDGVLAGPARALARAGAEVLVNPASDQWSYDQAVQPTQHLRVAMLRAVENGRWLLRPTPSGVTAVVDSGGRVRGRLEAGTEGILHARVPLLDRTTPYQRHGDWPYAAAALCMAGLAAALAAERPRPSAGRGSQARLDA
ncbi:MAG: apolipoprotein N-acyltransferase, partial [Elusimicrobia bacterium]